MDIRTRLSLALVAVSLVSMALLSIFAYTTSATLLREISLRQLDALAESKRRDLNKVYDSWEDMLRLVRERTQLRQAIRDHVEDASQLALQEINSTIESITLAVGDIDGMRVLTATGEEIAAFGSVQVAPGNKPEGDDIDYAGTFVTDDEGLQIVLSTPVQLDDRIIGGIELVANGASLFDITSDYTGLGETGEVIAMKQLDDGVIQMLNPFRFSPEAKFAEIDVAELPDELLQLFTNGDSVVGEGEDYRDHATWYAARYIPRLDWSLLVKVDAAEEKARAHRLRDSLFDIAMALSAFAIIGGALLGFYLARPITDLAVVVRRLRDGEDGIRAEVKGDDEIAYLAESMNELLDQVEAELDEKPDDA